MNRQASRLLAMARRWLGVDDRDRALDAELESFLQHEIDARIDDGMSPERRVERHSRRSAGSSK